MSKEKLEFCLNMLEVSITYRLRETYNFYEMKAKRYMTRSLYFHELEDRFKQLQKQAREVFKNE